MKPLADGKCRFGAAVRAQRKHLGISQEELAGRAGLHRTYVADVERGARNLSLASIEKLAHALEVPIPALFSQSPGPVNHEPRGLVDILLVESDLQEAERILDAFGAANVTNCVHVVRDGAQALEFISHTGRYAGRGLEGRPQVILLNLDLPRMSGLEVLRLVKGNRQTRAIPVVVLAGAERRQDVAASLQMGAEACLVKPIDFKRFAAVVPQLRMNWALFRTSANSRFEHWGAR